MARDTGTEPAEHENFAVSVKELAGDLAVLLRQDLDAARAEMVGKAKAAGVGAGLLSGSAIAAFLALFSLSVLLVVLLTAVMQLWIAVLLVTLFWSAATAVLALGGKRKFEEAGPPIPEQTIANFKADLQAAKEDL